VVWIIEFFKGTKVSYRFEVVCWLEETPWGKKTFNFL
jgi:hypothetical protein